MISDDIHGTEFDSGIVRAIDSTVPQSARVWDYWLWGKVNYFLELVQPGLVASHLWRPEHPDLCSSTAVEARAGVGRVA